MLCYELTGLVLIKGVNIIVSSTPFCILWFLFWIIHPSIHFLGRLSLVGSRGVLVPISSSHRARGGVQPGWVASPSQGIFFESIFSFWMEFLHIWNRCMMFLQYICHVKPSKSVRHIMIYIYISVLPQMKKILWYEKNLISPSSKWMFYIG